MYQELPRELLVSIGHILEPEGTYTDTSLNVQDTLNQFFPDEESLRHINDVKAQLQQQREALEAEVELLASTLKTEQDPERMGRIQELIFGLLEQMNRIREKATESEAIVRTITKDIQKLDHAKKNLSLSMTVLKRLQMLVNGLEQLDIYMKERSYPQIAQSLGAIKELSTFFKPYTAIDRIAIVWRRIQQSQGAVRALVEEDFDSFVMKDPSKPISTSVIAESCLVVDILGDDVRNHLIERYCNMELKDYRRIFRPTDEAGQLDNLPRRFSWFRRVISLHDEEHGIVFPESWNVGKALCSRFIEITAEDVSTLLTKLGPKLTVTLLLECLQQSIEFETFVNRKYGISLADVVDTSTKINPVKGISSVFEKHMGVFVEAQDKALADMMAAYRGVKSRSSQEGQHPEDDSHTVLASSGDLFYFYAQTLDQCAKFTTGTPLYDLFVVFKKWLKIYAEDVLMPALRRHDIPSQVRKSADSRLNPTEQRDICRILNTADYCHRTATQLEEKVRDKIHRGLEGKISLQAELDLFFSVISIAIATLLRDLEQTTEPCFAHMSRATWASINAVTGQLPYIVELSRIVDSTVEVIKSSIEQKKYLRNFYDKASSMLITKFTNALVRSRPLRDTGAEQALLDFQVLKACLLRMPSTGEPDSVPSTYVKAITKQTTQIETILKAVSAPVDPQEPFIMNYIILIGDSSFSNFQKILDLKGIPGAAQNNLLDHFLTTTSTRSDLPSTSFLSALDMDPGTGQIMSRPSMDSGTSTPRSTATGTDTPKSERREVLPDWRRLVGFAVRRDRENKAQDQ
ncbi:Vacuolar protein sorting-associated protein 53 AltName: Full=GARP complex subunit vps53 [Serendipita indica DSM 11827]|uniref:Related to VPS53-subunit of VP51-54 complex, required for protein sorting n=1 Tax=Serendipita indica (strain DSM 11827) TaxID=1109443 RepID=G4TBD8_SERID|nr:Vacuolar protein sorting-associated protein 53 AltName: Full=GARP complex subunit vps53 [Serendipita indica DSM 11827]CCA68631.1 related to VPS53-subunit of VP51-54 complex, required for protein sorting [Serendipita indica DSM 11827]